MNAEFYKKMIDKSPFGYSYHKIILNDKSEPIDYKFIEVNSAFEKLTGLESEKIINKNISEIIPDFDKDPFDWINFYGDIALNGGEKEFEQYSKFLNKHYKVFVYSPEKYYFITTFIDITNEINNSSELESFFQLNPDLLCIIDLQGNFIKANQAWKSVIEYELDEIIGHNTSEFVISEDLEKTQNILNKVKTDGKVENYVNRFYSKSGNIVYLEWGSQLAGDIIYGAARDITEKVIITENLRKSQEQYMLAISGSNDGIWDWNLIDNSLFLSAKWKQIIGYEDNEIISNYNTFESNIHKDDKKLVFDSLKNYLEQKTPLYYVEFRMLHKNGSYKWILARGVALRDESGKPYRMAGSHTDITERKKIESELTESERKYRLIAENSDDVIWILDLNMRFTFISPSIFKLRGLSVEDAMNENVTDTLPAHWIDKINSEIELSIDLYKKTNHYPSSIFEVEQYRKDGSNIWVEINVSGLYNENHDLIGIIGVSRNIDERKKAEEKLIKYSQELEITNNEKDKFFSIIAHDLKAPFSGFLGLTKILATQIQDMKIKEIQEFGINMRDSANNLYKLLENLLQWSTVKRGKSNYTPIELSLCNIVQQNIDLLKNNIKEKNIEIKNNLTDEIIVFADIAMVNTVFRNLLSNSIKYSNNNGLIKIDISKSDSTENKICIFIQDNGIGMDEEIKTNIFRIDNKITRLGTNEESGTGLGLLLCKEFIMINGGDIWFKSQPNIGTTFYFTLNIFKSINNQEK